VQDKDRVTDAGDIEDAVGISGVADPDLAAARSDRRHRLPVGRVLPALDEMSTAAR
jgi:hypothetical protein